MRERIANMISVNGCLHVFSIFGDTFSRSREKAVFESEKVEARTVFYIFLTFSLRIDASVNHVNGFSSIFAANIRSRLFSANDNKCKPGLRYWFLSLQCKNIMFRRFFHSQIFLFQFLFTTTHFEVVLTLENCMFSFRIHLIYSS